MELINFLSRWGHVLFGITWIGMLYYFNFVQGSYFKEAGSEALSDAKAKLVPRALWWFRWGAMFTFLSGVYLLYTIHQKINGFIIVGALMGTLMFLNVWLVIWPNQQIALGMKQGGDAASAGAKALLASRTNTLFSGPMAYGMLASTHGIGPGTYVISNSGASIGLWIAIALIALCEINALVGKQGPMTTVRGVIISSLVLTVVMMGLIHYV